MTEELTLVPQELITPDKNRVWISGKLETDFKFSHQTYLEKFYTATVGIEDYLGKIDHIVLLVSEQLLSFYPHNNYKDMYVEVGGELRKYAQNTSNVNLYIQRRLFASTLTVYANEDEVEETNANLIFVEGYVHGTPLLRTNRTGKNYTEFCLKVFRKNGQSDYIFFQAFGRTSLYASQFKAGMKIQVHGSLHSKECTKTFSDSSSVTYYDCKVAVHTLRKL